MTFWELSGYILVKTGREILSVPVSCVRREKAGKCFILINFMSSATV